MDIIINKQGVKIFNKRRRERRIGGNDKLFYIINSIILGLLALIVIYPVYYIVIASISDVDALLSGEVVLLPVRITFSGYKRLLGEASIWKGYLNTILYTGGATIFSLALTIPAGWALSRKTLPLKKFFNIFFLVPMFFTGGLIPLFLTVNALGLNGSPLAVILPFGVSVWNLFMTRAFFHSGIPDEIIEAAKIDGCNQFRIFFSVVIPLSKAIIAVMALYYAVEQWNSYFYAMVFLSDKKYFPLQLVLYEILISTEASSSAASAETIWEQIKLAEQIKYTSVIIASLPILIVYPFVQKYFEQGVMIGSIKS